MGKIKLLTVFVFGAVFSVACGTLGDVKFPYKFFHLSPMGTWDASGGKLVGDGISYDLSKCKPVKNSQGKYVQQCVVVFYSELNKLAADYKNTKQQLIDCQRGR